MYSFLLLGYMWNNTDACTEFNEALTQKRDSQVVYFPQTHAFTQKQRPDDFSEKQFVMCLYRYKF